jgi:hypothetical protein
MAAQDRRVEVSRLNGQQRKAGLVWLAWSGVALWLVFIYGSIPLARAVQETIRDAGVKMLFMWVTFGSFALAAMAVIRAFRRGTIVLTWPRAVLLSIIFALFTGLAWALRANPEEAFHFVQYGVLSLLLYRALRFHLADPTIFLAAIALGAVAGILDELIQWVTPRRYFDFRDIGINVLSGLLVQTGLGFAIRPASIRTPATRKGWRIVFRGTAAALGLVLFSLANTPAFKDWYTHYLPVMSRVLGGTAEYGHKITDADDVAFFSRLTAEELLAEDQSRGAEVGAWLSAYKSDRQYTDFLNKYPQHKHPFASEARIHLFRRDRYAADMRNGSLTPADKAEKAWVAHHENLILENYFPMMLSNSRYVWSPERKAAIAGLAKGEKPYISPVSQHLITGLSRSVMLMLVFILLVLALAGERWASRVSRDENNAP